MSRTYPGGILTANPPATVGPSGDISEGGSASGVWTMADASRLKGSNLWPSKIFNKNLWTWGYDTQGNLGLNTAYQSRSSPVALGADTDWTTNLATQGTGGMVIKTSGAFWAWSHYGNFEGRLGNNTNNVAFSSPIQIGALTNWAKVFPGSQNNGAIKTNGTMWAWGKGTEGLLGNNTNYNRSSPIQIGSATWSEMGLGTTVCVAITTGGALYAWGSNTQGFLGINLNEGPGFYKSSPVQIGGDSSWYKVQSSGQAVLALKTNGTMWTWGYNINGELGLNDIVHKSSPTQIGTDSNWLSIACGGYANAAIKTNGTLWSWGRNFSGQIGVGDKIDRSSPVQVGALTNWSRVTTDGQFVFALKTDRTIWTWGRNFAGRHGVGDTNVDRSSPVQVGADTDWGWIGDNRKGNPLVIKIS
jgi:alpha-tubulin suppressor-like RCC1 family protein